MDKVITQSEMEEMLLRGMSDKIAECLRNAENEKIMGNLKAWSGYLSTAARWAEKYRQTVIEMRTNE
jgi:hypothetical protein